MKIPQRSPATSWGSRSQLGATVKDLKDALGNKDGLWDNERLAPGTVGDAFDKNPLTEKIADFFAAGLSTADEIAALSAFTQKAEATWGQPVLSVDAGRLRGGELFAAQKAVALVRLGRTPAEVTDHIVSAKGSVAGRSIADREVFTQRFAPTAEPSGKVIVLSPGFQETGRNFYEQIQQMNARGHEVVVMDHQWAGQTSGAAGSLDSGFGVARDVAAVAAYAQTLVDGDPKLNEVVLFGNSMGGGPGVLGALTLNDAGQIDLEGPPMKRGLRAVLQAPFLKGTPNLTNRTLALASKIPMLNRIKAPAAGIPVLTTDDVGAQKGAQHAVLEDTRAQLKAMTAAEDDIDTIMGMIAGGQAPTGRIAVLHGDQDPLADSAQSAWLQQTLGEQVTYRALTSENHVLQENPAEQNVALDMLDALLAG